MFKVSAMAMLSAVAMALGLGSAAKADSIEIVSAGAAPSGSNWVYTYNLQLTTPNQIDSSSVIVFYDVSGYVAGTANESLLGNWTITPEAISAAMTASNGTGVPAHDDGRINLRFNFDAAQAPILSTVSNTALGSISFESIYGPAAGQQIMIAIDRNLTSINPVVVVGDTKFNSDLAVGPVVPVPAAAYAGLSMLGGLGVFGAVRRRRLA